MAKTEIKKLIDEGLNTNIITQEEYNAIDPRDKDVARFHCNFKVNKSYELKTASPSRATINGSGSITENASLFLQHHITDILTTHPPYIQDTPDFLGQYMKLDENVMLITME